jgi:hypothetical protein
VTQEKQRALVPALAREEMRAQLVPQISWLSLLAQYQIVPSLRIIQWQQVVAVEPVDLP